MNRTIRSILVATTLLGAALLAAPGVSALEAGAEDDGEKFCYRLIGHKTCVAVAYGDCLLWASAGIGGCFVMMPNGEYTAV